MMKVALDISMAAVWLEYLSSCISIKSQHLYPSPHRRRAKSLPLLRGAGEAADARSNAIQIFFGEENF